MYINQNKTSRWKGLVLVITLLAAALVLSACGSGSSTPPPSSDPKVLFDDSFTATGDQLNAEFEDMVYKNSALAKVNDVLLKSSKMTLELPEVLAGMGIPTSFDIRNDMSSKVMSMTATVFGRETGIYLDDENLTIQFLNSPIAISAKNFGRDLNLWMEANGMGSLSDNIPDMPMGMPGIGSFDDLDISYSSLEAMNSGYGQDQAEAFAVLCKEIFDDLKGKFSYEMLGTEKLETQAGSVDTTAIEMTISPADLEAWLNASIVKFEKDEYTDLVFSFYEYSNQMSGQHIYPTKREVISALRDLDLAGAENTVFKCNVYKNKVIKFEVTVEDGDDVITIALGLFGKDNLTDKVELSFSDGYDSGTFILEGNLIPKSNKVSYKISSSDPAIFDPISFEWDLGKTDGDNFHITADGDTVSCFIGLNKDKNFEVRFTADEIGGTIRFYAAPLDGKITVPAGARNLLDTSLQGLAMELMTIPELMSLMY